MINGQEQNKYKVAVIVVLYNPTAEVLENISTYIEEVDHVYLIDNSERINSEFSNLCKVSYKLMEKNIGLCGGLNIGCKQAIKDGYDILITMNQDTYCPKNTVRMLVRNLLDEEDKVFGANFKYIYRNGTERIFSEETPFSDEKIEVPWVITAGNIFSSEAYLKVGGYDEYLFIDNLDRDFCLRLREAGYSIVRIGDTYIYQEPGNTSTVSIGIKTLHIPNLSPTRYYYIFRNEIYLRNKYRKRYKAYRVNLVKYLVCILFFECDKVRKLKFCIKGYRNGKKGHD